MDFSRTEMAKLASNDGWYLWMDDDCTVTAWLPYERINCGVQRVPGEGSEHGLAWPEVDGSGSK